MAKTYVKLNYAGVREVLQSEGVKNALNSYAGTVLARLPDGYDMEERVTDRAVSVVYAATPKARVDNDRNNSLLKAGGV